MVAVTLANPAREGQILSVSQSVRTCGGEFEGVATSGAQLHALQVEQLRHDEFCHRDILLLCVADRMKHMALHFAKYAGRFVEAADSADADLRRRTLTDTFVIALAAANTLNFDVGSAYAGDSSGDLAILGGALAGSLGRTGPGEDWFVRAFVRSAGRLAKACESLDHVEAFPFREVMLESVSQIAALCLAEASATGFDLIASYQARLRAVEAKSIFARDERLPLARGR